MPPTPADRPPMRYELSFQRVTDDTETRVQCDSLDACVRAMSAANVQHAHVYDALTRKRGRIFPSGRIRWR